MLKKVPGFRTGKKWKKIVSLIGHVLMLLLIISSFSGVTAGDKLINGVRMMFFVLIPYVLLTNFGNIRGRIPLFKKRRQNDKKNNHGNGRLVICVFIIVYGSFAATEGLLSPRQKAIELVKKQQREIDSRLKKEAEEREEAEKLAKKEAESKRKRKRPNYRRKSHWRLLILKVMKQSSRKN